MCNGKEVLTCLCPNGDLDCLHKQYYGTYGTVDFPGNIEGKKCIEFAKVES